jgi:biopolymer transport protein ExbD
MAGSSLDDDDGINGINVTPMVDIILVLLVIFMVTTTTINQMEGMQIDKPDAKTGKQIDDLPEHMLLACRPDGTILIDGTVKEDDAAIIADIKAKVAENPDIQGVLMCDEESKVGSMMHLLDLMRENGIKKYAVATEQPQPTAATSGG